MSGEAVLRNTEDVALGRRTQTPDLASIGVGEDVGCAGVIGSNCYLPVAGKRSTGAFRPASSTPIGSPAPDRSARLDLQDPTSHSNSFSLLDLFESQERPRSAPLEPWQIVAATPPPPPGTPCPPPSTPCTGFGGSASSGQISSLVHLQHQTHSPVGCGSAAGGTPTAAGLLHREVVSASPSIGAREGGGAGGGGTGEHATFHPQPRRAHHSLVTPLLESEASPPVSPCMDKVVQPPSSVDTGALLTRGGSAAPSEGVTERRADAYNSTPSPDREGFAAFEDGWPESSLHPAASQRSVQNTPEPTHYYGGVGVGVGGHPISTPSPVPSSIAGAACGGHNPYFGMPPRFPHNGGFQAHHHCGGSIGVGQPPAAGAAQAGTAPTAPSTQSQAPAFSPLHWMHPGGLDANVMTEVSKTISANYAAAFAAHAYSQLQNTQVVQMRDATQPPVTQAGALSGLPLRGFPLPAGFPSLPQGAVDAALLAAPFSGATDAARSRSATQDALQAAASDAVAAQAAAAAQAAMQLAAAQAAQGAADPNANAVADARSANGGNAVASSTQGGGLRLAASHHPAPVGAVAGSVRSRAGSGVADAGADRSVGGAGIKGPSSAESSALASATTTSGGSASTSASVSSGPVLARPNQRGSAAITKPSSGKACIAAVSSSSAPGGGPNSVAASNLGAGSAGAGTEDDLPKEVGDLRGNVVQLSKTQAGSKYLQRQLLKGNITVVDAVLSEVEREVVQLMCDAYGNYLCSVAFQACTTEWRKRMLHRMAPSLAAISCDKRGTHALQALIGLLATQQEQEILMNAIQNDVLDLCMDANGTHVVQRMLFCFPSPCTDAIYYLVQQSLVEVAHHPYGLCVLKKCISQAKAENEHCPASVAAALRHREMLLMGLSQHALDLVQSPYGNYAIQHALEEWGGPACTPIFRSLEGRMMQLSIQKFSSNVVEKIFSLAPPEFRQKFIDELVECDKMSVLVSSNYGHYVVRCALDLADAAQVRALLGAIRGSIAQLPNRRLRAKWEKVVATGTERLCAMGEGGGGGGKATSSAGFARGITTTVGGTAFGTARGGVSIAGGGRAVGGIAGQHSQSPTGVGARQANSAVARGRGQPHVVG
eukprot:TRINITY_DN8353_c0_g1_i1.p1 TRINITY_DN8353_c0_g1~~TRINITY_DN8353_c0_g1_i1.p1  ORF type:complete len:1111 (+),score=187.30 TRINITY_DN8353_c0_g1_i1:109-3441(+)